jgi:hypothetical protein
MLFKSSLRFLCAAGLLFAIALSLHGQAVSVDQARNASGDWDSNGILDVDDNCSYWWNPDQKDSAADGIGDVCRVVELAANHLAKRLGESPGPGNLCSSHPGIGMAGQLSRVGPR